MSNVNDIVTRAFIAKEIFGVDPGRSNGGIAKYTEDKIECWAMKKINSFEDLVDFWKYQREICKLPMVIMEKITTYSGDMPKQGMSNEQRSGMIGRMYQMNKLKDHYVELRSALKVAGIPFVEAMSMHWQSYLKIRIKGEENSVRKRRYKDIAKGWFPRVSVTAWNADALLLIEFGRQKLKYDQRWILEKLKENPVSTERKIFKPQ